MKEIKKALEDLGRFETYRDVSPLISRLDELGDELKKYKAKTTRQAQDIVYAINDAQILRAEKDNLQKLVIDKDVEIYNLRRALQKVSEETSIGNPEDMIESVRIVARKALTRS
jgi:hypothetical protein